MAQAIPLAAVVVVGSEPGQRGGLLATDAADLRQAHQDGGRGTQRDTIDAGDQVEPLGEVTVPADRLDQRFELPLEKPAVSLDLVLPERSQTWITAGFEIVLGPGNLIDDLIDQRLMLGQPYQTRIRRSVELSNCRRARSDEGGVDLVVLGTLLAKLGVGTHLRGLEHDDREAIAAQSTNNRLLVAATRLDANALDLLPPQPGGQSLVPLLGVWDLQLVRTSI